MNTYPILYAFREVVRGKDFLAGILLEGSALAVEEAQGAWCVYGVRPGAIAAGGETLPQAFEDLRRNFRDYLQDYAKNASSFEDLQVELHRFFDQDEPETNAEWEAAVRGIRAGNSPPAGLTKQDSDTSPRRIIVQKLERPAPSTSGPGEVRVAA